MIYFFYDSEQSTWGYDPKDIGSWKVIYHNGDVRTLTRSKFPDDIPSESRFKACRIEFKNEISLPSWDSLIIDKLKLTKEERDSYSKCSLQENDGDIINKLLGYPNQIQGDMQLECELVSNGLYCGDTSEYYDPRRKVLEKNASDWILLLQIDSDENCDMMWGLVAYVPSEEEILARSGYKRAL